jgi:hypothetical protein
MSPAFSKKTIPEQFADTLLGDIRAGRFDALLPSIRELVVRYSLNPVSVHKGVTLLVRQGYLANHGPRRRLGILDKAKQGTPSFGAKPAPPCCRPLIFIGADSSEMNSTLMLATHDVILACGDKGGECAKVVLAGLEGEQKRAAVKEAMFRHTPTHVLLLYCDDEVYELVRRPAVKVAVLGGGVDSPKVTRLAADMALLATAAFEDLVPMGHRNFRLVMLGRPLCPDSVRRLADFSSRKSVDAQALFEGVLGLADMRKVINDALIEGVTAFAFPRPEDLVLAGACFEMLGVEVPKDVSLVMLLSGPYDVMKARQPAHFKLSKEGLTSLVLGWFESGENRSESITREAIATYVRGKTVGPARKQA